MLITTNMNQDRRILEPEIVHRIWSSIISLNISQNEPPIEYGSSVNKKILIEFLTSFFKNSKEANNVNENYVHLLINQANKENLIKLSKRQKSKLEETLTNGISHDDNDENNDYLVCLPNEDVIHLSHDWYCFLCNHVKSITNDNDDSRECSQLLECQKCWRVYHQNCVQTLIKFINFSDKPEEEYSYCQSPFICPLCNLIGKYAEYTIGSRLVDSEEFNEILSYTYKSFREKCRQISHSLRLLVPKLNDNSFLSNLIQTKIVSDAQMINGNNDSDSKIDYHKSKDVITQLSMYYLSYKPMSIADIEEKLSINQYKTIGEFFVDCLNVKHMLELVIFASVEHQTSNQKRTNALCRALNDTRYEVKEMIHCVDCYRNSNRQEDKHWFCFPCDPPHALVFAKQKGWPYWPAKVIHPRNIDSLNQFNGILDVRFFGSNHLRSKIDKSNIKDINSSMAELNIIKPTPALDKALSELRIHRNLLEEKDKPKKRNKNFDDNKNEMKKLKKCDLPNKKCNSKLVNGDWKTAKSKINDDEDSVDTNDAEEFMTEDSSDEHTEIEEVEENNKDTKSENTNICSSPANDQNNSSKIIHKGRGRPRKDQVRIKKLHPPKNSMKLENSNRIRKKKVIYSPGSEERSSAEVVKIESRSLVKTSQSSSPKKLKSIKRTKEITNSSAAAINPSTEKKILSERVRQALARKLSKEKQSSTLPVKATNASNHIIQTTSNEKDRFELSSQNSDSNPPTKLSSRSWKYLKKKKEIEREKELIKARRKLFTPDISTPKHIPPVVATKSAPTVSPPKPIVNQVSEKKTTVQPAPNSLSNANFVPQPINGFSQYNNNTSNNYGYITTTINDNFLIKSEADNKPVLIDNTSQLNSILSESASTSNTAIMTEDYKTPSSILKPLNSEGETDEDKAECDDSIEKNIASTAANTNDVFNKKNDTQDYDDDDEEMYLYDDEQLEDHIHYYDEYQKEKELEKHQQLNYSYQQPIYHHAQQLVMTTTAAAAATVQPIMPRYSNNLLVDTPKPIINNEIKTNGFIDVPQSYEKYIDFSQAKIYVPTKKNQELVNAYVYHMNNNKLPAYKNDFLATLIPKQDELNADETLSPRKRGRPTKNNNDSPFDYTGKAKCVLEKNYLDKTACNRLCLTNNVKAFKKYREHVESQSINEISKIKRELEEHKQKHHRLATINAELEKSIEIEKDLNKRFDPALLTEMEARHKKELSEVKRKQWCIQCEAEASFFCCFKTNYCSPQCQLEHWNAEHKFKCTSNRFNKNKKPD